MLYYGGRPVVGVAETVPAAPPERIDWGLVLGSGAAAATVIALFVWGLRAAGSAR